MKKALILFFIVFVYNYGYSQITNVLFTDMTDTCKRVYYYDEDDIKVGDTLSVLGLNKIYYVSVISSNNPLHELKEEYNDEFYRMNYFADLKFINSMEIVDEKWGKKNIERYFDNREETVLFSMKSDKPIRGVKVNQCTNFSFGYCDFNLTDDTIAFTSIDGNRKEYITKDEFKTFCFGVFINEKWYDIVYISTSINEKAYEEELYIVGKDTVKQVFSKVTSM